MKGKLPGIVSDAGGESLNQVAVPGYEGGSRDLIAPVPGIKDDIIILIHHLLRTHREIHHIHIDEQCVARVHIETQRLVRRPHAVHENARDRAIAVRRSQLNIRLISIHHTAAGGKGFDQHMPGTLTVAKHNVIPETLAALFHSARRHVRIVRVGNGQTDGRRALGIGLHPGHVLGKHRPGREADVQPVLFRIVDADKRFRAIAVAAHGIRPDPQEVQSRGDARRFHADGVGVLIPHEHIRDRVAVLLIDQLRHVPFLLALNGIDRDHEGLKNIHELRAEAVIRRVQGIRRGHLHRDDIRHACPAERAEVDFLPIRQRIRGIARKHLIGPRVKELTEAFSRGTHDRLPVLLLEMQHQGGGAGHIHRDRCALAAQKIRVRHAQRAGLSGAGSDHQFVARRALRIARGEGGADRFQHIDFARLKAVSADTPGLHVGIRAVCAEDQLQGVLLLVPVPVMQGDPAVIVHAAVLKGDRDLSGTARGNAGRGADRDRQ